MLNVNLCSEAYLEPSQTSPLELSIKPYFKNVFSSMELPLGSIFYTTHPFVKKLTTVKTGGNFLLLTIEQYFFSK